MRYIYVLVSLLFVSALGHAQTNQIRSVLEKHQLDIELRAGVIIGGMSPVPIPVEIRKILKYSPEYNGMFEVMLTKWLSSKYGFASGIRVENKGMETSAQVKAYHTKIVNQGDQVEGYWTGDVTSVSKISYLTIPLLVNMQMHERWRLQAGPYFSYNMTGKFSGKVSNGYLRENTPVGQKIEFKGEQYAAYDFSDELRNIAYGIQLSGQWKATNNLHVLTQSTWGLSDIFKTDFETISFEMYPIYMSFGASYQF
ncbi:MAG: hypothetical protein CSB02_00315 [Bacteroidia bacterium]|nr:MAG: hypothetical protein CSB02_00315 [Bacteroidia bacterium]